ncbi:MAG: crossover junction endodeoxyribonuclease RuvC [Chloroflexi bacterium]|nr:MAG: crossover junction endodeoxyribonuclease RuvC [Phototrophicales bacterium]RMF76972.1 MAG: crossover junction endodeoxyribonuclease RuvC [Chloroflexota bacterium]
MLSLGIDPGTATIGYGFVRERHDGVLQAVAYDVITTSPKLPMWERLKQIHDEIQMLVERYEPDHAAVEELFFARNVTTAITVAQGRGVILLALANAGVPVAEYKPNAVKQAVSGYGGAKKPQVQEMVRILLGLEEIPKPDDAADALAVAITDIHSMRYNNLLG